MKNISIEAYTGDYFIPKVEFNAVTGICDIAGESLLEDTIGFYKPLVEWLEEYTATEKPLTFNFRLTYFNTSSSKRILDILQVLKKYSEKGGKVEVNWYIQGDSEIIEDIEDYKIIAKLNINIVEE